MAGRSDPLKGEDAPAILLIGKTGAGKSTLANMLLRGDYFQTSDGFSSCTNECSTGIVRIKDSIYKLIDTPGIFDTDRINDDILTEISKVIYEASQGIKAILFVLQTGRFTQEQRDVISDIELFLGEMSRLNIIVVFTHANPKQIADRRVMENSMNVDIRRFLNSVGNRWVVAPNPFLTEPGDYEFNSNINDLEDCIESIRDIYTNELLSNARRIKEEMEQRRLEEKNRKKLEHDQAVKLEGLKEATKKLEAEKIREVAEIQMQKNLEIERITREKDAVIRDLKERLPEPSCFALDTKVRLESDEVVDMGQLQVGDRVGSIAKDGRVVFSEVYLISHLGHHRKPLDFIGIEFKLPSGEQGKVRMTPTHGLFQEDRLMVFSQDVIGGATKILVLNDQNEFVPVIADKVTREHETGYISVYTREGTIIADNVFCSCYDDCPRSQPLMDLVFAPIRLWTKFFPSTHREEYLHPYVQALETAYFTWREGVRFSKHILETIKRRPLIRQRL